MTLIASHKWGEAEIKYIPKQFSQKEIEKAAEEVKPDFHVPADTFVMVDKEGHHTLAQVPSSPAKHNILSVNGTDSKALVDVLKKTRDFLSKPPMLDRHSFSDLRSLIFNKHNKPAL